MPSRSFLRLPLVLILAPALVAGCIQTGPTGSLSPAVIAPASGQWRGSVGTVTATGGADVSPIWSAEISVAGFRDALERSLAEAAITAPGGPYRLNAEVERVSQPETGARVQVAMRVHYTMADAGGRTVFDHTVTTSYTSPLGQAVRGVDRLRIASEYAAQDNIALLLRALGAGAADAPTGGPL